MNTKKREIKYKYTYFALFYLYFLCRVGLFPESGAVYWRGSERTSRLGRLFEADSLCRSDA